MCVVIVLFCEYALFMFKSFYITGLFQYFNAYIGRVLQHYMRDVFQLWEQKLKASKVLDTPAMPTHLPVPAPARNKPGNY